MEIDIEKDLRASFGPVRDQDPRPTCMAFAASDAHAVVRSPWEPLSTEWAYYHALKRDGGAPHEGVTLASMLETLRIDGQPYEAVWPYITQLFTDTSMWLPPKCDTVFHRGSRRETASVETIIDRLNAQKSVLFTMSISRSFFRPEPDGTISAVEPLEPHRVHALVAVGHGRRQQERFVLVRNSWGEAWGLNGYGWVAVSYLKPRLLRVATMADEV